MRFLALCSDYDGTLATDGRLLPETITALERLIASGRQVVLVTGRELDDLQNVCPRLDLFTYVVAENGALLYHPATGAETPLARRPPDSFLEALRTRGVPRISVGRVIVATWEPHETEVLETIKAQGLELQVIFNKGAVMVLPAGVNKATGLSAALERMGLSAHNAVAVGDAENDHALLELCECGVAVANALPTLKEAADFVTVGDHGAGVVELAEALIRDDLASREPQLTRHHIVLGRNASAQAVRIRPYGETVLVAAPPDGRPPILVSEWLNRLTATGYTVCIIDPDGRYPGPPEAISLGTSGHLPTREEVMKVLRSPRRHCVVNLSALPPADRAGWVTRLIPGLQVVRERSGHPHWLIIDETGFTQASDVPAGARTVLRVTERPGLLGRSALRGVDVLIAAGTHARGLLQEFCEAAEIPAPRVEAAGLAADEVLAWRPRSGGAAPLTFRIQHTAGVIDVTSTTNSCSTGPVL